MNEKITLALLSGLLFACVQMPAQAAAAPEPVPATPPVSAAPPAAAPASADRFATIRRVPCSKLLELSNEDRATASMFYLGYEASRAGASAIDVGALPQLESLALSYCAARPDRPAIEAFAQAYALTR